MDMTSDQLAVFWKHFKTLDAERTHYEKPPSSWKPPAVRDMNSLELEAYWTGFREIMEAAASKVVEQQDTADGSDHLVEDVSVPPQDSAMVPVKRLRGKQSAVLAAQQVQVARSDSKIMKKGKDHEDPPKRSYKPKSKVSRSGKSASVSIWTKVQLFKDSRYCIGQVFF